MWTKDLRGNVHRFRRCTMEDVEPHFQKVAEWIPIGEMDDFKNRMRLCIVANTAFCYDDGSCYIYYKKHKPCCAEGHALYGKGQPLKLLALFAGVFHNVDKRVIKVDFSLYPDKIVQEYKSLITKLSLMRQTLPSGYPLVVRVDAIKSKILNLMWDRGITWDIQ